jgi:glycosyltransferase involved in cell wall biosynthesis
MVVDRIPASVVIPTRNRANVLRRTLESLALQSSQPAQIILVDASDDSATRSLCLEEPVSGLTTEVVWVAASSVGAASQRNQGLLACRHAIVGFFDDDILFRADCVARLWGALKSGPPLGGVSAMIENQRYQPPGTISRFMFRLMAGRSETSYAGRVLGPAVNLLPEDREDLPEVVQVEWLNTTCAMYRREALPDPPFPDHFTGYSMMEDVTLSLIVGRRWKLANARTARIFHDSQPGSHKSNVANLAKMELVNRHYVMTHVLSRSRWVDYWRLAIWELFQVAVAAMSKEGLSSLHRILIGKASGLRFLIAARNKSQ